MQGLDLWWLVELFIVKKWIALCHQFYMKKTWVEDHKMEVIVFAETHENKPESEIIIYCELSMGMSFLENQTKISKPIFVCEKVLFGKTAFYLKKTAAMLNLNQKSS